MSMVAGFVYGVNFVPCLWVQQNVEGASQDGEYHKNELMKCLIRCSDNEFINLYSKLTTQQKAKIKKGIV